MSKWTQIIGLGWGNLAWRLEESAKEAPGGTGPGKFIYMSFKDID